MAIIVSNVYPPDRGGIQTMMASLAEVTAATAGGVVVVAPAMRGSENFDAERPYRIVRYPDFRRPADALAIAIGFVRALAIARDRTTIGANWWPVGLAVALVPRFMRGKLAIFAHGSDVAPGKGGLRKAVMRFVYGRADAVLANSDFTKGLLARAGVTKRVRVVAPGVDVAPIEPARAPEPTILSVGRLIERKGFDRVIEALAALATRFPAVRYEIVGDGPYRGRLEALARRLGVSERVVFHGALSRSQMRQAYARAWCFALPVREVGSDVEGFGIVYLEAAMARLPAIGGLHSGAADAIVDGVTGFLVDGNGSAGVAAAIAFLISNRDEAERMGERALERARGFTWQRTADLVAGALGS